MEPPIHRFRNNQTAIPQTTTAWGGADENHLLGIRVEEVGDDRLEARGGHSSAVFFPIVPRGKTGVRVMLRADDRPQDVVAFCEAVREVVGPR